MEHGDKSLTHRLRRAALDRAHHNGVRVDDIILDADGVLDLRHFDHAGEDVSTAVPAAALAAIRGQLGDAAEVADLYAEEEERPRRCFGLWTEQRNRG